MKKLFFAATMLLLTQTLSAQPMNMEGMAGNDYLFYQHLFSIRLTPTSPLGIMNIANISSRYETDVKKGGRPNEIMNQAYLTGRISKNLTALGGIFYTNVTGIRASAAIQFALPFKNGIWVTVPRVEIEHRGSMELMSMLEYQPMISHSVKLYSRLQMMSSYGPYRHNRSYQRFRIGVTLKKTQVGLGLNLDEYGTERKVNVNAGLFIRHEII